MRARLARAWAHRKLARGQCQECGAVLRDDAPDRFCSETCAAEDWVARQW